MHKMKEKYYKKKASSILASIIVIITSLIIFSAANSSNVSAETSTATIRVKSFCSMTATVEPGEEHSISLIGGQYQDEIGLTTIQTFCNDPNGYAIYAIGYTGGDTGVTGGYNTVLRSDALSSIYDINTGTATSGSTSNWSMKLTSVDGTYKPTITNGYDDYHTVPADYDKVAEYGNGTDVTETGSSLTTTYAAYISPTQPAGTYTGQVKYVLVHPATSLEPDTRYMQDVDQWANTIEIGEEVVAYDNRDNKSYTVRRMCMNGDTTGNTWQEKEDNCAWEDSMLWMTQNLDFDLNSSHALNSINTDLNEAGSGAYADGYIVDDDVIYWTPANSTITSINTSVGKFNEWINSDTLVYSADPDGGNINNQWHNNGDGYNSYQCHVSGSNQTCNYLKTDNAVEISAYFSLIPFATNGSRGKMGNYYNWNAAIATNDSSSLGAPTHGNVSNNPKNSICPRGWRLPKISSGEENDFARLNNTYNDGRTSSGGINFTLAPIYMTRSGNVNNGNLNDAGYDVGYWSSTVGDSGKAYSLYFNGINVDTDRYNSRYNGRSIRCVSDYKWPQS